MKEVLNELQKERASQNKKWGQQDHGPVEWISILTEEVGEASKEAVDFHFKNKVKCTNERGEKFYHPTDEDQQDKRLRAYRKEMIQVAAVAIQAIECIDRNYFHTSKIAEAPQV